MESHSLTLDYQNITIEPFGLIVVDGYASTERNSSRVDGDAQGHGSGSAGAGHGGHGGFGSGRSRFGATYGAFRKPLLSGSNGGVSVYPYVGSQGGGRLKILAHDTLTLDGTISAKGKNADVPRSGGGSGGSILVYSSRLHGDGEINANGGNGDSSTSYYGGGGAAGRVAVYYRENHFLGQFLAVGGSSSYEPGGPGTVYLEMVCGVNGTYKGDPIDVAAESGWIDDEDIEVNGTKLVQNRTLYINAMGKLPRSPSQDLSSSYTSYRTSGESRIWVLLEDTVSAANESDVQLEELHLYGGAQLLFVKPASPTSQISIVIGKMEGDKSGRLHVGFNQSLLMHHSYLPSNLVIYPGGNTSLRGELRVAGVTVDAQGELNNCENITVSDGGVVHMKEMINNQGKPTKVTLF